MAEIAALFVMHSVHCVGDAMLPARLVGIKRSRFLSHQSAGLPFAQAGRLDGKPLLNAPHLPLEQEGKVITELQPSLPARYVLLGVDAYGVDCLGNRTRRRIGFAGGPVSASAAKAAVGKALHGPDFDTHGKTAGKTGKPGENAGKRGQTTVFAVPPPPTFQRR